MLPLFPQNIFELSTLLMLFTALFEFKFAIRRRVLEALVKENENYQVNTLENKTIA